MQKRSISSFSRDELLEIVCELEGRKFFTGIIHNFVWKQGTSSFDKMTSLPKDFRAKLEHEYRPLSLEYHSHHLSLDGTVKFLLAVEDGDEIEAVLIPDEKGRFTACISTQLGCAMRCDFCASTKNGLKRDLKYFEIHDQILMMQSFLKKDQNVDRVVVMGIGEPLANFENLKKALDLINSPEHVGIGARRITVSTVGLPAGIRKFAELPQQYNLAVSLHAPNDELRTKIIPTNSGTGIDAILQAADEFFETTGREFTIEYILLNGVNDKAEHAEALGERLKNRRCVVNLIPMNPIQDASYQAPTKASIDKFESILHKGYRIPTHVRRRKGDDIAAACGQLRLNRGTIADHELERGV